jgi:cation diffusion facilitator family transporter
MHDADREKRRVALSSVIAAVFLTGFKIMVGAATGSLGILAEALHSALDLVAAFMTYVAVRISAKPADEDHPYGHGKVESFSALIETVLLVATSVWIIYEAVERLLVHTVHIDPNVWAFVVMAFSIVVDYSRSRALKRAARKYQSQALEADALHFSTDIYSSAVVIFGLALVRLGAGTPYAAWLAKADAIAAFVVALIVLWVSIRLGKETIDVLLDHAPSGLAERIAAEAQRIEGVLLCSKVRLRPVGPLLFADLTIGISRVASLSQAHEIASRVETRLRDLHPRADIVVHCEPMASATETWPERVQAIASERGLAVHEVRVHEVDGRNSVTLHLEVDPTLNLKAAHDLVERFEQAVREELGAAIEVDTHIEPRDSDPQSCSVDTAELPYIRERLEDIVAELPRMQGCHAIRVQRVSGRLFVTAHCVCDGGLSVQEVHRLSGEIEDRLRLIVRDIERVHIHVEPPE